MTDEDERELESELARLQQEHRDLDAAIDALHQSPAPDLLRLQRLKKRKLQPVSYTHLRAHETVLDLVCRLLLEKKNTTNTAHTL